jgi:hypothetical protein
VERDVRSAELVDAEWFGDAEPNTAVFTFGSRPASGRKGVTAMSELIGARDEGGSSFRIPEGWVAADHTRSYEHGHGSVIAALVVCASSGALVGGVLGFVLGWLLT